MTPLPTYTKKNKAVIGLDREPINAKRYTDNLCLFRCIALHRGGDVRRLDTLVKDRYADYMDGDTNRLVSSMMSIFRSMSQAAYENIKDSYEDVLEVLTKARKKWDETLCNARSSIDDDDDESRKPINPYKTLMKQLDNWLRQLPVIGFNLGKYEISAIKQFLVPYFLTTPKKEEQQQQQQEEDMEQDDREKEEEENDGVGSFFVIKRDNTFMCLSTDKLKFLDMTNYIAPGFSYDKYLKANGCELMKGHYTYEYWIV